MSTEAAVGSISHILKTAFKDVYSETEKRNQVTSIKSNIKECDDVLIQLENEARLQQSAQLLHAPLPQAAPPEKHKKGAKVSAVKKDHEPPQPIPPVVAPGPDEAAITAKRSELLKSLEAVIRPFDKLSLGDEQQNTLRVKSSAVESDLVKRGQDSADLAAYLQEERDRANMLEELEEEELKRRGIMIGQHIPSLPTRLQIDRAAVGKYGTISQNIVVAGELVEQNKVNTLRRTGNKPISDFAEERKVERSKRKSTMVTEIPAYQIQTKSLLVREDRVKTRFAATFRSQEIEKAEKLATGQIQPPRKAFPQRTEVMSAIDRLANESVLRTMNHKLNYLQNPRNNPAAVADLLTKPKRRATDQQLQDSHITDEMSTLESVSPPTKPRGIGGAGGHGHAVSLKSKKTTVMETQPLFVAEPVIVEFTDYEIGQKYTRPVAFRNVSSISRTVRVLPPTTSFFSIEPFKYPTNSKGGYVAAGMAITSVVVFYPDSLGDYDDFLAVETEGGSFKVPIIARRESPQLSIPSLLDVGYCLVGDAMRVVITCANSGGDGRFRLLRPEHYPDVPVDIDWSVETCMRMAPFTIYPVDFALRKGESVDITVEYVPLDIGEHTAQFLMLCDNCQVRKFTLKACSREIDVSIVEVNGRPFESREPQYKYDLSFDSATIGTDHQQKLVVANDTGIPIEYEWVWLSPHVSEAQYTAAAKVRIAQRESGRLRSCMSQELSRRSGMSDNSSISGSDAMSDRSGASSPMASFNARHGGVPTPTKTSIHTLSPINELTATIDLSLEHPQHPQQQPGAADEIFSPAGSRSMTPIGSSSDVSLAAPTNEVTEREFTMAPARGVLPAEGVTHFTVTFVAQSLHSSAYRAVLVLKGVPLASFPSTGQGDQLSKLASNGHGMFTRLRSWIEEVGTDIVLPQAVAIHDTHKKKLISLHALSEIAKTCLMEVSDSACARFREWTNKCASHIFSWRKGEIDDAVDEQVDPNASFSTDDVLLLELEGPAKVLVYDWTGAADAPSVPVPPLMLYPPFLDEAHSNDGETSSVDSSLKIHNIPSEFIEKTMMEVWVDVPNALKILGGEMCAVLDESVKYEAVEYLQKYAHTSVACLGILASGEGRPQSLIIEPAFISVGGVMSIGMSYPIRVSIINPSDAMAEVSIDTVNLKVKSLTSASTPMSNLNDAQTRAIHIETTTPRVLLMPESEISIDFTVRIESLGDFIIIIPLTAGSSYFTNIDNLTVAAKVVGPHIRFNCPEVDLGLIGIGENVKKELMFVNESTVPAKFLFKAFADVDLDALSNNVVSSMQTTRHGLSARTSGGSVPNSVRSEQDDHGSTASSFALPDAPNATISVEPSIGQVLPGAVHTVTVSCTAGKFPQRVRGSIECKVFNVTGTVECPSKYLSFRGEVQSPKTIMYPMHISLGKVYVGMPVYFDITIENICNIPTKYKLERPDGPSSTFSLLFDKQKGPLEAKEVLKVRGEFIALAPGAIDDIIANRVFGMLKPLGFTLKAEAKSLLVEFSSMAADQTPPPPLAKPTDNQYPGGGEPPAPRPIPLLEMGEGVPLYDRRKIKLVIRNLSAIPATFQLKFAKFYVQHPAKRFASHKDTLSLKNTKVNDKSLTTNGSPRALQELKSSSAVVADESADLGIPCDEELELDSTGKVIRKDLILAPHEDGTDRFHSEEGKKHMAVNIRRKDDLKFLKSGLGASLRAEPEIGTLMPWGVQVITIRACNDMPGIYTDNLICELLEVPSKVSRKVSVPIRMTVQGCPLVIEKTTLGMSKLNSKDKDNGKPILLMGSGCVNSPEPLRREFRVRNNGSKPAKLKWLLRANFPGMRQNGRTRTHFTVDEYGKVKTHIDFWDTLLHDVAYTLEPMAAVVQPYSAVNFVTKLFRTDTVGAQYAIAVGQIGYYDDTITEASGGHPPSSGSSIASAGKSNHGAADASSAVTTSGMDDNFTLTLFIKGDFCYPSIRVEKHLIEVPEPCTQAPSSTAISLKAQAPLLFAKGRKPSDVCWRPVTLTNPLNANVIFSVSTEGPFTIKTNVDDATGAKESATTDRKVPTADAMPSTVLASARSMTSSIGRSFCLLPNGVAPLAVAYTPRREIRDTLRQTVSVTDFNKPNQQEGKLIVSFSTGQSVIIPLSVSIDTPFLLASTPRMFFGVCHVRFTTEGTLLLSNPTDVPARWTVEHLPGTGTVKKVSAIRVKGFDERGPETDDPSVFEITPNAGLVEGPTVSVAAATAAPPKDLNRNAPGQTVVHQHLAETSWMRSSLSLNDTLQRRFDCTDVAMNTSRVEAITSSTEADALFPMPLRVRFLPKKNVRYSSRFRFSCEYGNAFDVILQGEGTFEEHEHKPLSPFPR